MDTNTLNDIYQLDDEAKAVLKSLRNIMGKAAQLEVPLADDAFDLYMRLRVVLGAIESHAVAHDDNRQE